MSAWIVDRTHIDLLVKAAIHYGQADNTPEGMTMIYSSAPSQEIMGWWQTDADGRYAGWRHLVLANPENRDDWYTPSQLGQILVSENVASVSYRYSEPGRTGYYGAEQAAELGADLDPDAGELPGPIDAYYMAPYVYTDPGYVLSPGEVFHAIDCLDYQSSEHDGWRTSEAFAFLAALRDRACCFVDGYKASPWGWDADALSARVALTGREGMAQIGYKGTLRIVRPLGLRQGRDGDLLAVEEIAKDGVEHAEPMRRNYKLATIESCNPPLRQLLAGLRVAA